MGEKVADFRSDTVTKPTPEMRRAMAEAEVGDDVYGEDPTVNRLQERAAEILEKEAGIYVPTGSMGNQIAVHLQTSPGEEVLLEARGHTYNFELGAMSAISGVLPRPLHGERGTVTPEMVEGALWPDVYYLLRTHLLILENTHNMAGGAAWPPDLLRSTCETAHSRGLSVHLDGARIFNASLASGVPASELARGADTVMFCLSKGLGAPVGSMLCGPKELIGEARRVRKMLGGGMRQAGVIAAAGLVALESMRDRLVEDHENAARLAEGLSELPGVRVEPCETNIIAFELPPDGPDGAAFCAALKEERILASPVGPGRIRMVTHKDVGSIEVERALRAASTALGA
jgi:threonine aldolase